MMTYSGCPPENASWLTGGALRSAHGSSVNISITEVQIKLNKEIQFYYYHIQYSFFE